MRKQTKKWLLFLIVFAVVFALLEKYAAAAPANIIIIECDDCSRMDFGTYRGDAGSTGTAIDTYTSTSGTAASTPNIDNLADAGFRINTVIGMANCTPGKMALRYGTYPRRAGNLMGRVSGPQTPVTTDIEVNPFQRNIFTEAEKQGYESYFTGKWHGGNRNMGVRYNNGQDTHWKAAGVDVANIVIPHNITASHAIYPYPDGFGDDEYCSSHAAGKYIVIVDYSIKQLN